uniref:PX domain-containing protein n=1 Tax=Caenorhabditis tropicalis TaxID=1561998 RepID=A0A1I7UE08_9PELO
MAEAELAFVPAEHHERLQTASKVPLERCHIEPRWVEHGREVYVTFYTAHESKVVHMYLKEFHALQQLKDMATDLFPPYSYRVFFVIKRFEMPSSKEFTTISSILPYTSIAIDSKDVLAYRNFR